MVFRLLDVDKSSTLNYSELRQAFDAILKMTLTEEEFNAAVAEMDKNSDGSVTFVEFKKYFKKQKKKKALILGKRLPNTSKVVPQGGVGMLSLMMCAMVFVGSVDGLPGHHGENTKTDTNVMHLNPLVVP